ncbi:MAG TPA: PorV/PorQ family protein [Bacteroidia bacterium]|mgnify:CR=1 FL=1|nr:PorV/PorQ family protein [Bacteroidia bacterium]MBP7714111.1 PorV/PorQ family protein [Bacteroidia bacterium]MBP8669690.1 PorV/PorQ family protein [Bacteroidia bacterium]HOZ83499.1 PorV/PorQ family protein [Bacteroidia bacterium]HQW19018.1 PorV/PorQ family protein [Bacteroidia bacterium]
MTYKFKISAIAITSLLLSASAFAGNEDRVGQSGANELIINPWVRSAGWMNCNTSSVRGLEAQYLNVAGTAFTKKTEIGFSHTNWLKGTGISINSFGITQHVGESGALTLGIMSMDFGNIEITTPESPEGGIGTYKPQFLNVGLSYAKAFSNSIYGGITIKIISESVADVRASGIAFDAGIQYVTGFNKEKDNLRFGIALKNVGAPLNFKGDGLASKGFTSDQTSLTISQRAERFELPSLVNIGAAYDFKFLEMHRITLSSTFTSNSFTRDQTAVGLEYGFKKFFALRAAYSFERKGTSEDESLNVYSGFGAGITVEAPIGKSGKTIGLDYSYRPTYTFDGTHAFGVNFKL